MFLRCITTRIEERGGMVAAIESGWVVREIGEEAYRFQREVESGERVVVGLNRFTTDETPPIELHRSDPTVASGVRAEVDELRKQRDDKAFLRASHSVRTAATP